MLTTNAVLHAKTANLACFRISPLRQCALPALRGPLLTNLVQLPARYVPRDSMAQTQALKNARRASWGSTLQISLLRNAKTARPVSCKSRVAHAVRVILVCIAMSGGRANAKDARAAGTVTHRDSQPAPHAWLAALVQM